MRASRKEYMAEYHRKNREKLCARSKEYQRAIDPEIKKESRKKHYLENKEKENKASKKYRANNKDRMSFLNKRWDKNNKGKRLAMNVRRRQLIHNATPKWYDKAEVEYIYSLAAENGLVVDHIVPLNSKLVCGLNVQDNMRCIPKMLNSIKSNTYWPDMAGGAS